MWIILLIIAVVVVFGLLSDTKREHKYNRKNSWEANDDLYHAEDDFNHYAEEHDVDENGYCADCDEYEDDIDENE